MRVGVFSWRSRSQRAGPGPTGVAVMVWRAPATSWRWPTEINSAVAAQRAGVPQAAVVRLCDPRFGVRAPARDQCFGELRGEEQVAEQLAVEGVGVGVQQAAEERDLRRAVRLQQAAVVAAED